MKKITGIFVGVFTFVFAFITAYAAPSSFIGVSRNQIEVGQTVTATVTIKNVASWNVKISGTGNTNSCSTSAADATANGKNATKSFTLTCKANSTGVIRIAYSGDATSEDGANVPISGSKTVTVVAARAKSSNNNLKSLSVDGGVLTPEFNPDVLEYSTTFEPGTTKVIINAEKADGYASLTGNGEKDVVEGDNRFEIVVTSETGNSKTYVVVVTVKEYAPIVVKVDGKEYSLVRKIDQLVKPDSFEEATVQIGEDVLPAFHNDKLNKTLVGLKDENGLVYLYEYKDGNYIKYIEAKSNGLSINIIKMDLSKLPKNYSKFEVKFGEEVLNAYKVDKDSKFAIVYGIDVATGEKNLYQLDLENNTIQLFNKDYEKILDKYNQMGYIILGVLGGVIFLEFIIILLSRGRNKKIVKKIKKQKIEKVKEAAINDAKKDTVEAKKEVQVEKDELPPEKKELVEAKKEELKNIKAEKKSKK